MPALWCLAALMLASAVLGAGSASAGTRVPSAAVTAAAANAPATTKPIQWVIDAAAIKYLRDDKPPAGLLSKAFSKAYVPGDPAIAGLGIPAVTYTSYVALSQAVTAGKLPGPYQAVLLDLEHWPATPFNEQVNTALYEQKSENLVHAVKLPGGGHMTFLTAPAVDLVFALCKEKHITCHGGAWARQHFLSWHLIGGAARYSDVVDIQAQGDELRLTSFAQFVVAAAAQAAAANRAVKAVVGLSTDNGKNEVFGYQLIKAFHAVWGKKNVAGFWLNIPKKSTFCPACRGPFPGPALVLLKNVYG